MEIIEVWADSGKEITRLATPEEIETLEAIYAAKAEEQTNAALRAEQKSALLERLGITAEEATLLLS